MLTQNNYNSVFTDYLSVTFNPDEFDITNIQLLLLGCGYELDDSQNNVTSFSRPDDPKAGYIRVENKFNTIRISVPGLALAYLRNLKQYDNLLLHFSTFLPNVRVTRLDAAKDEPYDFPPIHRKIARKYPDDRINLGRKQSKIKYNLTKRDDGQRSGSVYMGTRKSKLQIIIYDKALEQLEKADMIIPTTTRYEMRFKSSFGMTLRDASDPTELFWSHSHHILLKKPKDVLEWHPHAPEATWTMDKITQLPYAKLSNYIEYGTAVKSIKFLADQMGAGGRKIALRLLTESFRDTPEDKSGSLPANVVISREEVKSRDKPSLPELQQRALKELNNK